MSRSTLLLLLLLLVKMVCARFKFSHLTQFCTRYTRHGILYWHGKNKGFKNQSKHSLHKKEIVKYILKNGIKIREMSIQLHKILPKDLYVYPSYQIRHDYMTWLYEMKKDEFKRQCNKDIITITADMLIHYRQKEKEIEQMINEHADELRKASVLKRRRKAKKMIRTNAIEIESPDGMEKLIDEYVAIMLDEEELKRKEEMEKYDNEDFEEELLKLLIQQEKEWNDQETH